MADTFAEGTNHGSGRRRTILLIEDEPLIRLMLNHVLEHAGYQVFAAVGRKDALEYCRSHDDIALILSDLCVSGGDSGLAIVREAREMHPGIKALFISAHEPEWIARHESRRLAGDVLQKPFKPEELLAFVRRRLDQRN